MHDETAHPHPQAHPEAERPGEMHPPAEEVGPGYEVRDTNVKAIVVFGVGLFTVLIVTQFAMWGLLNSISGGKPEPADPLSTTAVILDQKHRLRAEEDAALGVPASGSNTKGMITSADKLSIAGAIDRIARDGLPKGPDRARSEIEVNSHSGSPATEKEKGKGSEK
jgi:hypothetical protein